MSRFELAKVMWLHVITSSFVDTFCRAISLSWNPVCAGKTRWVHNPSSVPSKHTYCHHVHLWFPDWLPCHCWAYLYWYSTDAVNDDSEWTGPDISASSTLPESPGHLAVCMYSFCLPDHDPVCPDVSDDQHGLCYVCWHHNHWVSKYNGLRNVTVIKEK